MLHGTPYGTSENAPTISSGSPLFILCSTGPPARVQCCTLLSTPLLSPGHALPRICRDSDGLGTDAFNTHTPRNAWSSPKLNAAYIWHVVTLKRPMDRRSLSRSQPLQL